MDASAAIAAAADAEAAQVAAEAAQAAAEALFDQLDLTVPGGDRLFGYDGGDTAFKAFESGDFTSLGTIGGSELVMAYNSTGDLVAIPVSVFPSTAADFLANLLDVDISSPQDGQALTYDTGTSKWVNATPASTFLDLTDAPDTYVGQALKLVRVNAGETAVEFFTGAFTASAISFTPAGTIAATDVQTAIEELDSEMDERIADVAGAMVSGNTETLITVTYQDVDNTIDFVVNSDLSLYNNATSGFLTATTADALFLTPAEGNAAYQPLDSDLTSWAGVTRASGFDTFAATPSMANLASLLTDDASGWATFGTTPTSANLASLVTDDLFQLDDAELGAIAGLSSAANKFPYFTGSGTAALADLSANMRTFLTTPSSANFATLVSDDLFSLADAELGALAGLTSAADKLPYFTGSGTAALADLSSAMRTFLTTSSSANWRGVLTDETGTGAAVFADAPQMSTIELGHATDTTLARTAAGRVTIEGKAINSYTYSASAPSSPLEGDKWVDSDDLTEYTYVNDGDSSQWVALSSPAGASYWGSITGAISGSTGTIGYTTSTAAGGIQITSTEGGTQGPWLTLYHNSPDVADADINGVICFAGKDESGNAQEYAAIYSVIDDATGGTEDSHIVVATQNGGATSNMFLSPGGIRFPGTQISSSNANQLDDYEEGTWTPGMTFGGSATGVTFSTQNGTYTKVGRNIFFRGYVVLTSNGSGTGSAVVTGLPFTAVGTSGYSPGQCYVFANASAATGLRNLVIHSSTTFGLHVPGAAADAAATHTNITDTADFHFSGFYQDV